MRLKVMVINSSFHIPPCASIIPITSCKYVGLLTLTQYTPYRRTKGYKIFFIFRKFFISQLPIIFCPHFILNWKNRNNILAFRRFCCRTRLPPANSSKYMPCNVYSTLYSGCLPWIFLLTQTADKKQDWQPSSSAGIPYCSLS